MAKMPIPKPRGIPKPPGMPKPNPSTVAMQDGKVSCPETGYVYYETVHDTRKLNKGVKKPPISLFRRVDNGPDRLLARIIWGGMAMNFIRPMKDQAENAALQWYMNSTEHGRENSTVVKKYKPRV